MTNPLANLDRCVEVAGDDRCGRFLRKLFRWHSYTKISRDGQKWVALTRVEWEAELGCSPKQFRLVLEKMTARGLIVRERHRYKGVVTMFLRPSDEAYLSVIKGQTELAQKGQTGMAQKGQSYIYNPDIKPGEETKAATGVAAPENVIPFPDQGGSKMAHKAEDVIKGVELKKKKPIPIDTLKPDKVESFVAVWRKAFIEMGKTAPAITMKMRGQIKQLLAKWPDGQALKLFDCALKNWGEFTYRAEKNYGAFKSPDLPQMGYLLKYAHVAQDLVVKAKAAEVMMKQQAPVQTIAPTEPVKKYKPATLEEIMAIDAEFEKKAS
jgi:hypothetical protein